MSKKLYVNQSLMATPTDPKHLVNLETVTRMVDRKLKDAVRAVASINITGTYADKVLTTTDTLVIDGVTLADDDRVLLAGQTDATQNGIYVVTDSANGVLTRAEDFDDSGKIPPNVIIPVMEGNENADTNWQLVNDTAVTLDSTSLSFAKFTSDAGVHLYSGSFAGDGTATSFTITHGLNSENVEVQIYDKTTKELCEFGVETTTANTVTIKSDVVIENTDEFNVIVIG